MSPVGGGARSVSLRCMPWSSCTVSVFHSSFGDSEIPICFGCQLSVVRCPWSASVEWCHLGSEEGISPRTLVAVLEDSSGQQATDNRQRTRPFQQKLLRREFQLSEGVTFGEEAAQGVTNWSQSDRSVITIDGVLLQRGPPHGGLFS